MRKEPLEGEHLKDSHIILQPERYRIVEQLAMKLKDVMLISKAYRMIAYVERQRGNWDVSYKYYTDALAIAQKLKDVFGMSSSLRGLGISTGAGASSMTPSAITRRA